MDLPGLTPNQQRVKGGPIVAAAAALPKRPAAFDLILASDVLLYLGDLGPLFEAVHQAMRPGGRFAFTVDLLEGAGDYRLTPWVHFAHSRSYLQQSAARAHLREVSKHYWAGLFHTYDQAGLPRTNNGMEIRTSLVMAPYVRCTIKSKTRLCTHDCAGL